MSAMARSPAPPPAEPDLSVKQLHLRIEGLEQCIRDVEALDPETLNKRHGEPQIEGLEASIEDALSAAFGHGTATYNRYRSAAELDQGPHSMRIGNAFGRGPQIDYEAQDRAKARMYVAEGKPRSVALLQQAIKTLRNRLAEKEQLGTEPAPERKGVIPPVGRRIFIVHGHDGEAREAVARFLGSLDFEPIILHEQANQGRTVIEKVEAHGDVAFAVVLLTADDMGRANNELELEPRARQNVLLELGYFIGRLGRPRVCALLRGNVKVPSDFAGVVWEPFDAAGGWKQALSRELQAAGYAIDWNKVMK
jgi:predicted nucleotide-binding protein